MLRTTYALGTLFLIGSQAVQAVPWGVNDTATACGPTGCNTTAVVSSDPIQTSLTSLPGTSSSTVVFVPVNASVPTGSTDAPLTSTNTSSSTEASLTSEAPPVATLPSSAAEDSTAPLNGSLTTTTSASLLSLGDGITATAQQSNVVIANSTISAGGPAFTVSSVTVSLASSGIINVDGTTTTFLPETTVSSTSDSTITSVTETMTTLPTGVSTEGTTISGVSTNTWLTTTRDGQTTILPVIWCPNCENGGSVLIWNLPSSLTNIEFDWPDLPSISFPCIKVFGVNVGDCPAAKTEDSDDSDDDTLSSSSSSETCTSSTVSDCRVGCSVSTFSSSSTTTVCYTTSCFSTVGCDVQPTTSTTVSTSSSSQKTLTQKPTPYNMGATWSSLGMDASEWYFGATLTWTGNDSDLESATATDSMNATSATSTATTTNSTAAASSTTSSSATTSETAPWCYIHGDSSNNYYCQCGEDSDTITSPLVSGSCPYTSHAITTTSSSTTEAPVPGTTTTTYWNGVVQECTSYSKLNVGVAASVCIGPTIYSPTSSSAQPTSTCATEFSSSLKKLFEIHGSDWDDTLGNGDILRESLEKCSGKEVSDWSFEAPPGDGTSWDFLASGTMEGIQDCYEQASIDSGGCTVGGEENALGFNVYDSRRRGSL